MPNYFQKLESFQLAFFLLYIFDHSLSTCCEEYIQNDAEMLTCEESCERDIEVDEDSRIQNDDFLNKFESLQVQVTHKKSTNRSLEMKLRRLSTISPRVADLIVRNKVKMRKRFLTDSTDVLYRNI